MASDIELFRSKYNICATQCCICHKLLTDPSSIEYGIGPVCRKSSNYDDAPMLSDKYIKVVNDAIHEGFPPEMTSDLQSLVVADSPATSRQLAKMVVYYASYLVGKPEANKLIHCIQILLCLGYEQLSKKLLENSYRHVLWTPDTDMDLLVIQYKGPFNALVNAHFKANFKGRWNASAKQWDLEGELFDCMSMLINAETGHLSQIDDTTKKPSLKFKPNTDGMKNPIGVKLNIQGASVGVVAPYNFSFKEHIKNQFKGKWDPHNKQWIVDMTYMSELSTLIKQIYPNLPITM